MLYFTYLSARRFPGSIKIDNVSNIFVLVQREKSREKKG